MRLDPDTGKILWTVDLGSSRPASQSALPALRWFDADHIDAFLGAVPLRIDVQTGSTSAADIQPRWLWTGVTFTGAVGYPTLTGRVYERYGRVAMPPDREVALPIPAPYGVKVAGVTVAALKRGVRVYRQ